MRFIPRWLAASAASRPQSRRARLHATPLERRDVPALYTVTAATDGADTVAGTLRWAITQANTSLAVDDTIAFALGGPSTIALAATLPTVVDGLTVQGPGAASLTITPASGGYRAFEAGTASTVAVNFKLSGVTVRGITGASGGGLLVNFSNATLTSVTFDGNVAADGGAILLAGKRPLSITDCTFTNNQATESTGTGWGGGAVASTVTGATLTVTNSAFTGNTAGDLGGAVVTVGANVVQLTGCTFTNNTANASGGAVACAGPPTGLTGSTTAITLTDCRVEYNSGALGGGLWLNPVVSAAITRTSFVGNVATYYAAGVGYGGGGLYMESGYPLTVVDSLFRENAASGGVGGAANVRSGATFRNTTIIGNYAPIGGGLAVTGAALTLQNCTVVRNTAVSTGGGLAAATVTLTSSVVALNTCPGSPDIAPIAGAALAVAATRSFVGIADTRNTTISGTGNLLGTAANPADPALGPVAANGGPLATAMPLAGSPLIDAGSNPANVSTDARGAGFPRQVGAGVDIGAVERTPDGVPSAAVVSTPLVRLGTAAAGQPYSFSVRYADDAAVSAASANDDTTAVTVTGPNGFKAAITVAVAAPAADAGAITVTYTFAAPGGSWDAGEVGTYTIALAAGAVQNAAGQAVAAGVLGTFRVVTPLALTVTTTADAGAGSLRAALALANGTPGDQETITFGLAFPATIALTSGELSITDGVTLQGPGADQLTLAGLSGRILNLSGPAYADAAVSGLTLTGAATSGAGGAIACALTRLTLSAVRVVGNTATGGGGAVYLQSAGPGGAAYAIANAALTVTDCTIGNNTGGAVVVPSAATVTITRSELSGNVAAGSGGAVSLGYGTLVVADSLLADNRSSATGTAGGGGAIFAATNVAAVTVTNSTLANNTAAGRGGAVNVAGTNTSLTLTNSTVVGNQAGDTGGGAWFAGRAAVVSSVVAGNAAAGGYPALSTAYAYPITVRYSALDDVYGYTPGTTEANLTGQDFGLSALRPNGGSLRSVGLYSGSPLIDAGLNPLNLVTDVRGRPRVSGGGPDIGAVERDGPLPPGATATIADVTAAGPGLTFTVTYRDETAISAASVAGNLAAVRVLAPGDVPLAVTAAVADSPTDGPARLVTYTVTPPGGAWDAIDNGAYTVSVAGGQAANTAGAFVPAADLATFRVAVAGALVVATTADAGPGSLRQALLDANATTAADTIVFNGTLFTTPQTISLVTGNLTIANPVTVVGPAGGLTLTPAKGGRILAVNGPGQFAVQVNNVAFVGGSSTSGGGAAVAVADELLTLTNCRFSNNRATQSGAAGGAVAVTNGRQLTLVACSFTGSTAVGNGGAVAFGTANAGGSGTLTVTDCTFTANTATNGYGGAVYSGTVSTTFTVTRSTFDGNKAVTGGAIALYSGTGLTLTDSAVVRNSATQYGGGVYVDSLNTPITLTNATLAQNKAPIGGAMFSWSYATLAVRNSTVVQNEATQPFGHPGAGFAFGFFGQPTVVVTSSAIGDNRSVTGYDFEYGLTAADRTIPIFVSKSAIGGAGNLSAAVSSADLPLGVALMVAPLLDTTGARPAVLPLPGSPLIDAGSNPLALTTDGRGLARQVGAAVDVGAAERVAGPTIAAVALPTVTGTGTSAAVSVTFADDQTNALAAASLAGNTAAITATGPTGPLAVAAATLDVAGNGSPRTVTYTLTPPGGFWDTADFGTYTVTLAANQAKNTAGQAVPATTLGTFTVRYRQTFTVTNTLDDGSAGSLRWAVAQANAATGTGDTVAFAPGLTGTITLASQVVATDSVTVAGAGAAVTLTGASGVLNVAGSARVTLADFAIRGATAAAGAALVVGTGTSAVLTRMLIADNTTTADGRGGAVLSGGTLDVSDSTFTNNVGSGTGTLGGAIAASRTVTVSRSTFRANRAGSGGAVYGSYPFTVADSLFADNTAAVAGGAVYGVSGSVVNSTLVGNAAGVGGAVYFADGGGTLSLERSTVVGNAATGAGGQGGGVYAEGAVATFVHSSAVAGNAAVGGGPDLFHATGSGTLQLGYSLIGVGDSGFTAASETATLKGTQASPLDPQLGPLQNNGGPTLTRAPLSGSPVIDQGANRLNAPYDQRGVGYARAVGAATDIGAVEAQPPAVPDTLPPTVTLVNAPDVATRNGGSYTVTFNLVDNYTVDAATVQPADFAIAGPGGIAAAAMAVALAATNPLTATVTFTPPGGTWTADDNGTYTVSLTGSVLDVNGLAAATGPRGTFTVAAPVGIASVVAVLPDGTTTPLSAAGQRSTIPVIRVLFDGPATGADAAAAYKLVTGTTTVPLTVTATTVNGRTQATLTPPAPLADGTYTLTAFATAITTGNLAGAVQLDGNNDGSAGGNYSRSFSRYLADFDGDTAVDGNDLAVFAGTFNAVVGDANYRAWLDLDGDGAIDGNDLAIFAQRFNSVL